MTGYGRATFVAEWVQYAIEIKSVNNKTLNLNIRTPLSLQERENDIRTELMQHLERWSVTIIIDFDKNIPLPSHQINKELVIDYYHQILHLSEHLSLENTEKEAFTQTLRMPGIFSGEEAIIDDSFWLLLQTAIAEALGRFNTCRSKEWGVLENDIQWRIRHIQELHESVTPFEQARIEKIKSKIYANLEEFIESEKIDKNRFEQEVIYYLEQIDFSEERTRLAKHCDYFLETTGQVGPHGKKLDFIAQEIGREINTMGSKARDADIQRIVVQMKDELEKIKEQLANIS